MEQQLWVVVGGLLNNNYEWSLVACWTAVMSGHLWPVEQQIWVVVDPLYNNYKWSLARWTTVTTGCLYPVEQQLLVVISGMLNSYKWSLVACWTTVMSGYWWPVKQQLRVVVGSMLNNSYAVFEISSRPIVKTNLTLLIRTTWIPRIVAQLTTKYFLSVMAQGLVTIFFYPSTTLKNNLRLRDKKKS